ncbi:MAG: hypothetical protein KIT40_13080 [Nitrospira sp.]|nr:hypothetical protein [Nitrospira sp.]
MNAKRVGLAAGAVMIVVAGCGLSTPMTYPGTALTPDLHETGIIALGEIEGCRGAYCPSSDGEGGQELPLGLASAPPASSYHTVLRKRAAIQFHVSEQEVRLGEVTVRYYRELDGTIIGWKATAPAGRLAPR